MQRSVERGSPHRAESQLFPIPVIEEQDESPQFLFWSIILSVTGSLLTYIERSRTRYLAGELLIIEVRGISGHRLGSSGLETNIKM
ncbi:hypothetical protein RRG08_060135 [Elysia crispata]|uniref:Uncharacterized protein n=1 Tax=Elysia crispata TaxID=231223 RepID=A0AAE0ZYV2_9GAST|nr:hypothetical protein RRG08_060135 [Elysia crispata]